MIKIALLGYGKMGKEIEQLAVLNGHQIVLKVDETNATTYTITELKQADVAIEFSTPQSAVDNILKCFEADVPVVVGTTGWLDRLDEITQICNDKNQAMLWASNFSIGVNIFFEINKKLAQMMNMNTNYEIEVEEIHHKQKLDSPSGTGLTLTNDIIHRIDRKDSWINSLDGIPTLSPEKNEIHIRSLREENVPGTHTISYVSDVDSIEITHTAFSRKGFAAGALVAAEWIIGQKGVFKMSDMMKF